LRRSSFARTDRGIAQKDEKDRRDKKDGKLALDEVL